MDDFDNEMKKLKKADNDIKLKKGQTMTKQ